MAATSPFRIRGSHAPARLSLIGIPWHIIQRDNNRSPCLYTDEDSRRYPDTLCEQADKHGCAIHAYVLMSNHAHLLLTPTRRDSAALLMKHLGQRYGQYVNRTYRRSGTLRVGRFRSCLARSEAYVLVQNLARRHARKPSRHRTICSPDAARP